MPPLEARDKALELRRQIREGTDPMEERRELRQEPTLGDLIDAYLNDPETLKLRPNTLRNYRGLAERHIRPALGSRRLKAINRSDIAAVHAKFGKSAPYEANRMLALLSVMYNYALSEDRAWVDRNPVIGIKRHAEEKRKRYLSTAEIKRLQQALEDYRREHQGTRYADGAEDAVNALRLLLLTGSRLSEVLSSEWNAFDLDAGVWTKPSHHTKQKTEEHVPLSAPALELLRAMKPRLAHGPLFIGRYGKLARVSLKRPWEYATERAGITDVRLHDLRHSFASHLASSGTSLAIVGKLLGHTQASTTLRYAHLQDKALRDATNQVSKLLSFPAKSA